MSCRLRFPDDFLVPDGYKVMVKSHVPNVFTEDCHRDIINFMVVETGSQMLRYQEAWRYGCVLVDFEWEMKRQ